MATNPVLSNVLCFLAGLVVYYLYSLPGSDNYVILDERGCPKLMDCLCPVCLPTIIEAKSSAPSAFGANDAIFPILREWGCGHENLEVPKVLMPRLGGRSMEPNPVGRNRIVIDVGLGADASETLHAVANGFVVFSFDPDAANIQALRKKIQRRGMQGKFHFVELVPGQAPDFSTFPSPPGNGGFGYVYLAGLGDSVTAADLGGKRNLGQVDTSKKGHTPILTLDASLPPWAQNIFFFKIDTQGYELKVLKGATRIMQSNLARYILFEFSPRLMDDGHLGNHTELLKLLPSLNFTCFDMMGTHLALPRPSSPITAYEHTLLDWKRWGPGAEFPKRNDGSNVQIGPWDDIMCANWMHMLGDRAP